MRVRLMPVLSLGLVLGLGVGSPAGESKRPADPRGLDALPAKVRLNGPEASQRLVVLGKLADGSTSDLSSVARIEAVKPGVVRVEPDGTIRPVADGTVDLTVRVGTAEARVA